MKSNYQVLIVGGGTAGIMVAAQLKRKNSKLKIGLIEPSDKHAYQAAWTLVGAGTYDYDATIRPEAGQIPKGVDWIQDYATSFDPQNNSVNTKDGSTYSYEFLVVCPGIQINVDGIPGLKDALGKNGVCSNYTDPDYVWETIKNFKGGNALFTQPTTPIKCGGAPQKIAYLAADYWRKNGVLKDTNVIFATPGSVIFGVKDFANTLMQVIHRYGIHLKLYYALDRIDGENNKAYYHYAKPGDNNCVLTEENVIKEEIVGESEIVVPYDMLHLAPPQSAPDFIRESDLVIKEGPGAGWVDVNINTMQHNKYGNIFSLGDVAHLPTAKTGAAVRKQVPVVVENIIRLMTQQGISADKIYEGYSSCPLVTGYGKMVLAEFKYDNVRDSDPLLSKFVDTSKENWSMWILKKYGLPFMYWNMMMKGKM